MQLGTNVTWSEMRQITQKEMWNLITLRIISLSKRIREKKWKLVNDLCFSQDLLERSKVRAEIKIDNQTFSYEIAEAFTRHFASVVQSYLASFSQPCDTESETILTPADKQISLHATYVSKVRKLLQKLDFRKATGLDIILLCNLFKLATDIVALPLTRT